MTAVQKTKATTSDVRVSHVRVVPMMAPSLLYPAVCVMPVHVRQAVFSSPRPIRGQPFRST